MGKKLTKDGMVLRRAIRATVDAAPGIDHAVVRKEYGVAEGIVASALTRTLAEWDAAIAAEGAAPAVAPREAGKGAPPGQAPPKLGIEQGFIMFRRKPAKMGEDHIFWVPRVYIKNGLVDPSCVYEVYLKRKDKGA
ncbi:MAG: hypothetical protein JXR94_06030 [Candidatus Hydrogenedentes bacterium]|nr:hypothetical protein [Candidatus Hydrogenedentota bacterium]